MQANKIIFFFYF